MKNKLTMVFCAAALLLVSCKNNSAQPDSSVAVPAPEPETPAIERQIQARVVSYKDKTLTYEYKGETVSVNFDSSNFTNGEGNVQPEISEKIISNRYGEKVIGKITLNHDGTTAVSCDVVSLNGSIVSNSSLFDENNEEESDNMLDVYLDMKRLDGSKAELSSQFVPPVTVDLNDLDNYYKLDFPELVENVEFTGYRFNSGTLLLDSICILDKYEVDPDTGRVIAAGASSLGNDGKMSFSGSIESLENGRAKVLLNDGETVCDVPAYYYDEELSQGQKVLVTLNADETLYGSGKEYKDEFAVFYTDIAQFTALYDFDDVAYCVINLNSAELTLKENVSR